MGDGWGGRCGTQQAQGLQGPGRMGRREISWEEYATAFLQLVVRANDHGAVAVAITLKWDHK